VKKVFILVLAAAYGLLETAYFGWHATPSCPEELICDGIVVVLCAIAVVIKEGA